MQSAALTRHQNRRWRAPPHMAPPRGTRGRKPASVPPIVEKVEEPPKDPLDFETLSLEALRKYRAYYSMPVASPMTTDGFMIRSGIGKMTSSTRSHLRASKREVAAAVKEHFLGEGVRESETIVDFVYAVQNKDKVFKLQW